MWIDTCWNWTEDIAIHLNSPGHLACLLKTALWRHGGCFHRLKLHHYQSIYLVPRQMHGHWGKKARTAHCFPKCTMCLGTQRNLWFKEELSGNWPFPNSWNEARKPRNSVYWMSTLRECGPKSSQFGWLRVRHCAVVCGRNNIHMINSYSCKVVRWLNHPNLIFSNIEGIVARRGSLPCHVHEQPCKDRSASPGGTSSTVAGQAPGTRPPRLGILHEKCELKIQTAIRSLVDSFFKGQRTLGAYDFIAIEARRRTTLLYYHLIWSSCEIMVGQWGVKNHSMTGRWGNSELFGDGRSTVNRMFAVDDD